MSEGPEKAGERQGGEECAPAVPPVNPAPSPPIAAKRSWGLRAQRRERALHRRRVRVLRHTAFVMLEVAAGALFLVAATGAALSWRLQQGPVEIAFLTPYIEQALNRDLPVRMEVERATLSWDGFGAPLKVAATDILALGKSGRPVATIPELRVSFSLPALLRGRLAPSRVELIGPRLAALRHADGSFHLDLLDAPVDVAQTPTDPLATAESAPLDQLVAALQAPPDPTESLGALSELRITDARVSVENRQTGATWQVPDLDVVLLRGPQGIQGTLGADIRLADRTTHIDTELRWDAAGQGLTLSADLADLRPNEVADLAPVLEPLKALDLGFSGKLSLRLDPTMTPQELRIDLTGGAGTLTLPGHLPEPVAVAGVRLQGRLTEGGSLLSLETLALDLGGPSLGLSGTVRQRGDALDLALRADLAAIPMNDLGRYWPSTIADKPRTWMLGNMADGVFDSGTFELAGTAPAANPLALSVSRMQGRLALSGFTVHYLRPLPPMTGVAGIALFDGKTFDIDVTEGRLDDLTTTAGKVLIQGLDTPNHSIDIRVPLEGPLATALAVLDHEPLGYAKRINLKPELASGTAKVDLRFAFPLIMDLPMERVEIRADATLEGVAIPDIVAEIDASEGVLEMAVTASELSMTGTARLNGVPSTIEWQEYFADEAPVGTIIRVRTTANSEERARFNLDFPEWIEGPVDADLTYRRPRGARQRIDATVDATQATLLIDLMKWRKEPGIAATGELTVEFIDGRPVVLPRFSVVGEGISATGRLRLWPQNYALQRLELESFKLGDTTDAAIDLTRDVDGATTATVRGQAFDARPFRKGDAAKADGTPPVAPPPPPPDPGIELSLDVGRVTMGDKGQALSDVVGTMVRRDNRWSRTQLDARVGLQGFLKVRYWPEGESQVLTVESNDGGAALRELDVLDYVRGGTLTVAGRSAAADPTRTVAGSILLTDYKVQDAPVLARLLAAASPRGFAEFFSGAPLSFDRLEGSYYWHDRGITLRDVRTSGSAVGLTLEGDVDYVRDRVDLQGTIVPFSGINRLVGSIPLLGDILTGGGLGAGILAATFAIEGPLDKVETSVNPLAILTPGFLRDLLFLGKPAGAEIEIPKNQPIPGRTQAPTSDLPPERGAGTKPQP